MTMEPVPIYSGYQLLALRSLGIVPVGYVKTWEEVEEVRKIWKRDHIIVVPAHEFKAEGPKEVK